MIITEVRIVYPHLMEPTAFDDTQAKKYECTIIIPKDSDKIGPIKAAVMEAARKKWGNDLPQGLRNPIRDGDAEDARQEFEGHWYFKAKSTNKPGVIDGQKQPITDEGDIRSGDYVNIDAHPFSYDRMGNGVSFGLNNVQFLKSGDRIGGGAKRPEDVFDSIEVAGSPEQSGGDGDDFFS